MTDLAPSEPNSFVVLEADIEHMRQALYEALNIPPQYLVRWNLSEARAQLLALLSNRPLPLEFVGAGQAYENVCVHGYNIVACTMCCIGDRALDSWIDY